MKLHFAHLKTVLALFGCISLVVWGCSFVVQRGLFPWEWEELSRLESSSGKHVVILMRGNRGAMSGFRYAWYVVRRGDEAPKSKGWPVNATFVSTGPAPTAKWTGDYHLTLRVKPGIFIYTYVPFLDSLQVGVDVSHESSNRISQKPNQAPEPTTMAVTLRASSATSDLKGQNQIPNPARSAPAMVVAHL